MLVLASSSPRRRELLTQAGFSFEIHPAHIPEDPYPNEDPIAYVTRLAREKAQVIYNEIMGAPSLDSETWECTNPHSTPGAPSISHSLRNGWDSTNLNSQSLAVLGADTTVTLDNHILGKPENPADAARILRLLSGRTHRVLTGVAVVTAAHTQVASESTAVQFLALSDEEIASYIATGEPLDKAGAYAIQGRAARWIPRIEGDYFNVMGLPIALVYRLLTSALSAASLPRQ